MAKAAGLSRYEALPSETKSGDGVIILCARKSHLYQI